MEVTTMCSRNLDAVDVYDYFVEVGTDKRLLEHGIIVHRDCKVLFIIQDDDGERISTITERIHFALNVSSGTRLAFNATMCDIWIDYTEYDVDTNTILCYGWDNKNED